MAPSDGREITELIEELEEANLEDYALKSARRRKQLGELFRKAETKAPLEYRTEYHRDRDRIIWSKSFKRLQNKTQVFPHYVEDHYKRRLTHSFEVAQIATTIARALRLNEVATEAMALGHDLGHTPFGHAGEEALNEILKDRCRKLRINASSCRVPILGFDHCVHAIEVVSRIEEEYTHETKHGGLNLTHDVRDGILKHMFDRSPDRARPLSHIGSVTRIADYEAFHDNKGSLEAQCVYFADKLAYLLGDIEDGVRSNILNLMDIADHPFLQSVRRKHDELRREEDKRDYKHVKDFPALRSKILTIMILESIEEARAGIKTHNIKEVGDVFDCGARLVKVSKETDDLWTSFYRTWMEDEMFVHQDVAACTFKAKRIVVDLFHACHDNTDLINESYQAHCAKAYAGVCDRGDDLFKLIVARNYVAGMTDSFATQQHARLFMSSERISV